MALLDVIKYGHPTLRQMAEPYAPGEIDGGFVQDMIETMKAKDGVGLAAPQVNVSKRFIVVSDSEKLYTLVNPEVIAHSESTVIDTEGCLSLPGLQASVTRWEKVIIRALDVDGEKKEITARGLLSRVLQHEIDHLNGVLYLDRADISTLTWINGGEEHYTPTTLEEVQREYKKLYHAERRELFFETV